MRKGYLKIHFAVNTKTKESTKKASVEKVAGDGAYDTKDNFNHLKGKGIEPAIKVKKNASTKSRGSRARAAEVKEFKRLGYDAWRKEKGYGRRWQAETAFSTYKRTFGEYVSARTFENMVNEISLKMHAYNMLINGG